mgnify:CR=1 FL=1
MQRKQYNTVYFFLENSRVLFILNYRVGMAAVETDNWLLNINEICDYV